MGGSPPPHNGGNRAILTNVEMSSDGGMVEEVNHRITEAKKAWKKRHRPISRGAEVGMYEGIIEPSLLYGCEVWTLDGA